MSRQKVALILTEQRRKGIERGVQTFHVEKVAVPLTRIAKVGPHFKHPLETNDSAKAEIALRTPEDYMQVIESVQVVAALMNGEARPDA